MSQTLDRPGTGRTGVPWTQIQIGPQGPPEPPPTGRSPWRVAKVVLRINGLKFPSKPYLRELGLVVLEEDFGIYFHQVEPKPGWTVEPPGIFVSPQFFRDEARRIRIIQYVNLPEGEVYIEIS